MDKMQSYLCDFSKMGEDQLIGVFIISTYNIMKVIIITNLFHINDISLILGSFTLCSHLATPSDHMLEAKCQYILCGVV